MNINTDYRVLLKFRLTLVGLDAIAEAVSLVDVVYRLITTVASSIDYSSLFNHNF